MATHRPLDEKHKHEHHEKMEAAAKAFEAEFGEETWFKSVEVVEGEGEAECKLLVHVTEKDKVENEFQGFPVEVKVDSVKTQAAPKAKTETAATSKEKTDVTTDTKK